MVKRYKKREYFQYLEPIIHMERLDLSTGGVGSVLDPTHRHRLEGEGTRNRLPIAISQVSFKFGWWSVGGKSRRNLQKFARICKKSPDSAKKKK